MRWLLAGVAVAVLAVGCSDDDGDQGADDATTTVEAADAVDAPELELSRLSVAHDTRPRIVDEQGREVLLRGVNLNGLGDYFQGDPDEEPVMEIEDADWDAMAARGFSVVRLIVSWSKLEPTRGELDPDAIAEIHDAVDAAAERGIWTVIDFHQDAWGRYIATPDGHTCPAGLEPAIGWDGAPEWATITDGAETCRTPGNREESDAVKTAFRSFYANRDGIRDAFVATVGKVAAEFADEPAVAGYELLNEPNLVLEELESIAAYSELVVSAVSSVRAAETAAGGPPHLMFIEPLVVFPLPGTMFPAGVVDDPNLVFAPHNYAEMIPPKILTVEQTMEVDVRAAADLGWPLWIGEYGVFDTDEEHLAVLERFAVAQDDAIIGGAAWQWQQSCGDPHSVGTVGGHAADTVVVLNLVDCPGNENERETDEFLDIIGRAYARTSPGRLTELTWSPDDGSLKVAGTASAPGELVIWFPGQDPEVDLGPADPAATTEPPETRAVPGGSYVTVNVAGPYEVTVGPSSGG